MEKLLLGNFMVLIQPRIVVELGVYQAVSTMFLCDFLAANNIQAQVVGFDMPSVVAELRSNHAGVQQREAEGRLRLMPGYLPDALAEWLQTEKPVVDLALIDAMHDYPHVTAELNLLWPHLSVDAAIFCHDYSWTEGVAFAAQRFAARRKDAQILSLMSSPEASTASFQDTDLKWVYGSSMVALRRRPIQISPRNKLTHLLLAVRWHRKRWRQYIPASVKRVLRPVRRMLKFTP